MKEERCFNDQKKGHIILNCLENAKIYVVKNVLDIKNIKNIDYRKNLFFLKTKKVA